jgi:signal transduction histidine kinase
MTGKHLRDAFTLPERAPVPAVSVVRQVRRCGRSGEGPVLREAGGFQQHSQDDFAAESEQAGVRSVHEFVGLAVHDLTQPVQALELAIEEIERTIGAGGAGGSVVVARVSVARMRELLRMLLEICRIEAGAGGIEEQPLRISELFEYLQRQFSPGARAKGLAFRCEPAGHVVQTDAILLRSLLANLVSNAIRYTLAGEVRLRAHVRAGGSLCLEVSDTGIGIASTDLKRIFEDFHRLEAARRATRDGFGLGLGIVRRVSRVLGLPVTVQSSVGRGSTFRVEIPSDKVLTGS